MASPGAVISSTKALLVSIQALLPESGEVGLGPSAAAAKPPVASTIPTAPPNTAALPNIGAQRNTSAFLWNIIVDTRVRCRESPGPSARTWRPRPRRPDIEGLLRQRPLGSALQAFDF